jgi:hypothetical protein
VAFIDKDRIVALDPPFSQSRAEFHRHRDGRIAWLRWGQPHRRAAAMTQVISPATWQKR